METFGQSALSVTSGSQVSLHWATTTDEYFVLRSASPDSLPQFGSPTVVALRHSAWIQDRSSTWQWWSTTSGRSPLQFRKCCLRYDVHASALYVPF